jgi:hypothetical protein
MAVDPGERWVVTAGMFGHMLWCAYSWACGVDVAWVVLLHAWPGHRDRMRAMAVDPGERWVVTAGVLWFDILRLFPLSCAFVVDVALVLPWLRV